MKKPLLLVLATLLATTASAQQNCDEPRDDFDGLYCLNKVYLQTDTDLNAAYRDLVGRLSADARQRLKQSQIAWIEARNSSCSRRMDNGFYVNLRCATAETRKRLEVIQERTRECKSSGCQPSKL